ncbi:MAG: YicC family protein [Deltaproteobacteria bacterium]|nr:YicC family protein [Deltaproteobacteria bacterium]
MIKSMTGFGSSESYESGFNISVEIKSVNHRFLEIKVRLPYDWSDLEISLREFIKKNFKRGYFEVSVKREVGAQEKTGGYHVNLELAKNYYKAATHIARALKLEPPQIGNLLRNQDIIHYESKKLKPTSKWDLLKKSLKKASQKLLKMRLHEGKNLEKELLKHLHTLKSFQEVIEKEVPQSKQDLKERLEKRLQEVSLPQPVNPERLEQEVVFLCEKADITEEVVRLKSHIEQFEDIMRSNALSIGKNLDFLTQEMNREINTISSKANYLSIHKQVVAFKTELEKLKEQVQNIE